MPSQPILIHHATQAKRPVKICGTRPTLAAARPQVLGG
jgi:hypothetical protein